MSTLRITNGRVIDPSQGIDQVADLWVRGEHVLGLGPQPQTQVQATTPLLRQRQILQEAFARGIARLCDSKIDIHSSKSNQSKLGSKNLRVAWSRFAERTRSGRTRRCRPE